MGVEALLCLLWTVARNTLHAVGYGFGAVKPADSELRVDLADPAPQSTIQVTTGSTAVCSRMVPPLAVPAGQCQWQWQW